jgi:hypothetical protein
LFEFSLSRFGREKINIMDTVNRNNLKSFIFEASQKTYASGDQSIKEKQSDGSTTIQYEREGYKYHDNYFGGEPYGGREVVFMNNKPVWMMVYYGSVKLGTPAKEVYSFLTESLSNAIPAKPYRGPDFFQKLCWRYENKLSGELDKFSGIEMIFKDDICVYEASYAGGFVAQ